MSIIGSLGTLSAAVIEKISRRKEHVILDRGQFRVTISSDSENEDPEKWWE